MLKTVCKNLSSMIRASTNYIHSETVYNLFIAQTAILYHNNIDFFVVGIHTISCEFESCHLQSNMLLCFSASYSLGN